jgi:hypothetical protein
MEHWWNDIDGKTKELGEKPIIVPLCPPQVPHGLPWEQNQACDEKLATNLCYDTVKEMPY